MKKIASTLLAVILVSLMLTACGGAGGEAEQTDKAAYQVFLEAAQKHDNAKAVDATVDLDATVVAGTDTVKVTSNIETVRDMADIDNPLLFLKIDVVMAGEESGVTLYYYGGNMYADENGSKVKRTLPLSEIYNKNDLNAAPAPLFDETKVKNVKIADKDGGKEITFTVIDPTSQDYMKMVTTAYTTTFADRGLDPAKLSIKSDDMVVTAFVDEDGVLKSFSFNLVMKLKYDSEIIDVKIGIVVNVNAIENVTVPKPFNEGEYIAA